MTVRLFLALVFASGLLVARQSRADYDWYNEKEGSSSEPDDHAHDDDDYVAPEYEGRTHAADEGFAIGLRLAYAHPLGELAKGGDLEDFTRGVIKGQLDLDYGLSPEVVLGLYLAVGGGFVPKALKRTCDLGDADCKLLSIEAGVSGSYRILPDGLIDPWLGANLGLEWLRNKVDSSVGGGSTSFLGLAFGPSIGADVQLGGFAFGPYFSPQFGLFMRAKAKFDFTQLDALNQSGKIRNQTIHYWLNFGLRARYQF